MALFCISKKTHANVIHFYFFLSVSINSNLRHTNNGASPKNGTKSRTPPLAVSAGMLIMCAAGQLLFAIFIIVATAKSQDTERTFVDTAIELAVAIVQDSNLAFNSALSNFYPAVLLLGAFVLFAIGGVLLLCTSYKPVALGTAVACFVGAICLTVRYNMVAEKIMCIDMTCGFSVQTAPFVREWLASSNMFIKASVGSILFVALLELSVAIFLLITRCERMMAKVHFQ